MRLVVGLGNPGQQYNATRHNIGASMLKKFLDAENLGELKYDNKWKSEILVTDKFGERVMFCFPQTYMNASGDAVGPIVQFYKIPVENILVLHDEIDFIPGRIAYKKGGSAAGHNGLKSIISHLGSLEFNRIRIGVGRPATSNQVADYVLSTFRPEEKKLLDDKFTEIQTFILEFLKD